MRNLKKLLALVVVVAMAMTLAMPVFAADASFTYSAEAQKLNDMGLYDGITTGTFTPDLGSTLNRETGVTLLVKMLGKKAEAEAMTDADATAALASFKDADKVAGWAKKYVAFAVKNGISNGMAVDQFGPAVLLDAKMFCTMMLRNLGYTVTDTGTAIGLMKEKGGLTDAQVTALAAATTFTKDSVVGIAFGALNAVDSTGKTLVSKLIDAKVVTEAAAVAAGVYTAPVTALEVDTVTAVTNTIVEVALKTAVTAVDAASFTAKDKAGTALAVSAATLSADGKTVTVTTAAQVAGALYKLSVAGTDYEFVGLVKDETAPELKSAMALTNLSVRATFDNDDLDAATALNPANYTVSGLTITAAAWGENADGDIDHSLVVLTTSAQTAGKVYELDVTKVTDRSGNVMDDKTVKFGGKPADTTDPKILSVVATDNTKVKITFTEAELLDAAAANDAANYTINNGLTVSAAELDADTNKLGDDPEVTLTTSAMTAGKVYTLTIKNIKDAAGNQMDSTDKNFGGVAADTSKLNLNSAIADTNTKVKLTFDDNVDTTLGADVANYTIDGLTITAAEVDGDDNKLVYLTTSAQTAGKVYTVKVANLKDDSGNVLDTSEKKFGGVAADTTAPKLSKVTASDNTTVKVVFNEKVNEKSAETLSNYSITELGYPTKATLEDDGVTVTLKTTKQASKVYTLTISNVTDTSGNKIDSDNDEKKFSGIGDDLGKVTFDSAYAADKYTVVLTFNKALNKAAAENTDNYTIKSESNSGTNIGATAGADVFDTANTAVAKLGGDDDNVVTITFPSTKNMNGTELYTVTVKPAVVGVYGAALDTDNDEQQFGGISSDKADITADVVNVIDNKTIEVVFSGNVSGVIDATKFALYEDESKIPSGDVTTAANLVGTGAGTIVDDNKVKISFATALKNDTVYYLNVLSTSGLKDYSGLYASKIKLDTASEKSEAVFATSTLEAPKLAVDAAVMLDKNTVEVTFNHNITLNGLANTDLKIIDTDDSDKIVADGTDFKRFSDVDDNKLTIYFAPRISVVAGHLYKITFNDAGANAHIQYADQTDIDLGDNTDADETSATFGALATDNERPYILSAQAVADDKVKVTFSEKVLGLAADASDFRIYNGDFVIDPAEYAFDASDSYDVAGDDSVVIVLANTKFASGTSYDVAIDKDSVATDIAGIGAIKRETADNDKEESIQVSGVASVSPMSVTSATYDISAGTLTLTGTFLATAAYDVDITKVTVGGVALTVASALTSHNATTVVITIAGADKAALPAGFAAAGTVSGGVTFADMWANDKSGMGAATAAKDVSVVD